MSARAWMYSFMREAMIKTSRGSWLLLLPAAGADVEDGGRTIKRAGARSGVVGAWASALAWAAVGDFFSTAPASRWRAPGK